MIIDLTGKVVLQEMLKDGVNSINLSGLFEGVYEVVAISGNKNMKMRLFISK